MAKEIERKFLARLAPGFEPAERGCLRQAYIIATKRVELRIRDSMNFSRGGPEGYKLALKLGVGLVRDEFEYRVPTWLGRLGFFLAGRKRLYKERLKKDGWEIDRFIEPDFGKLILAEAEIERETSYLPRPPEGLILVREVTGEPYYSNKHLARLAAV